MTGIKTFVERIGIADHPGFRVSQTIEGYRDYTFGCRAGPGRASVRNLAHELAHAAEFGAAAFSRRCFMGSFCFKVRKVRVLGSYYPEPRTCGATQRELRTFALQLHLLQHAGVSVNVQAFARRAADIMVRFMPDWWNIPGDSEQERKRWCAQKVIEHHEHTTVEATIAEITAWLDATQRRLARHEKRTPIQP